MSRMRTVFTITCSYSGLLTQSDHPAAHRGSLTGVRCILFTLAVKWLKRIEDRRGHRAAELRDLKWLSRKSARADDESVQSAEGMRLRLKEHGFDTVLGACRNNGARESGREPGASPWCVSPQRTMSFGLAGSARKIGKSLSEPIGPRKRNRKGTTEAQSPPRRVSEADAFDPVDQALFCDTRCLHLISVFLLDVLGASVAHLFCPDVYYLCKAQ
jgi:hypothetical protein